MITTLLFHLGGADDLIRSTPLFKVLLEAEPELRLILITSPENKSILEGYPLLSDIQIYNPSWRWKEKWHFIQSLRKLNPVYAFSLSPQGASHWLSYFTGAGIRGGVLWRNPWRTRLLMAYLLHHRFLISKKNPQKIIHQTQALLNLARQMGFVSVSPSKISYTLPIFEKERL